MERIAVAGLSLHTTDVAGLSRARRPSAEGREAFLRELADVLGASELVFLSTCNRVEVVLACEEGEPADRARLATALQVVPDALCWRTGRNAARHLFRVAASLDSLVVGEDQVLAQVREAFQISEAIGLVGPLLGPLFQHALAAGKDARARTDLARHPVSVVSLAVQEVLRHAGSNPRVAVLGAGEMGRLLVRSLAAAGLAPVLVVNRTLARAEELGTPAMELSVFRRLVPPIDVLLSATSAPGPVLSSDDLARLAAASGRLLAVDLAVPGDLPPTSDPRVRRVDLEHLRAAAAENRLLRAEAAAAAELVVEDKLETFARRFAEREVAELVGELRSAGEELLARELRELLEGRLAHLPEQDRRAVERWARRTYGRLMHLPTATLKRLVAEP